MQKLRAHFPTIARLLLPGLSPNTTPLPAQPMLLDCRPVPYNQIPHFTSLFSAYTQHDERLRPFVSDFPAWEAFERQIQRKASTFSAQQRTLLQNRLRAQMDGLALTQAQIHNLNSLTDPHTFTVSCGHQLNIGGGPMYVAYKILTVLKLAQELRARFPAYRFVPVHWLATEDHDLEEIKPLCFDGVKYRLNHEETGAVGRMGTGTLRSQLEAIPAFPGWASAAYAEGATLASATRVLLQKAFGEAGLLMVDGDDVAFKQVLLPLALMELSDRWIEKDINQQNEALVNAGFKPPIHARDINLFYLHGHERLRLEAKEGGIQTADGAAYRWTQAEAAAYFSKHPEKLSPNVAFRPLYSQMLLPDLAFVGGPAETGYWLQLKTMFDTAGVPFPLLVPRFSALYLTESQNNKTRKLGLAPADLMAEHREVRKKLWEPEGVRPLLPPAYMPLLQWASEVDPTLVPSVQAAIHLHEKEAERLRKKILKAAERKNEVQAGQLQALKAALFPGGGLQERTEGWISFYNRNPLWLEAIAGIIDPLDMRFQVVAELG